MKQKIYDYQKQHAFDSHIKKSLKIFVNKQWTCLFTLYNYTQASLKGGVGCEKKVERRRTPR